MGKLLLPDWVARRRATEELLELFHQKVPKSPKKINSRSARDAHKAKLVSKRRAKNKQARKSRRRNRV